MCFFFFVRSVLDVRVNVIDRGRGRGGGRKRQERERERKERERRKRKKKGAFFFCRSSISHGDDLFSFFFFLSFLSLSLLFLLLFLFLISFPCRVQSGILDLIRQLKRETEKQKKEQTRQREDGKKRAAERKRACVDERHGHQNQSPTRAPPFFLLLTLQHAVAVRRRRAHVSRARRATAVRRHGDERREYASGSARAVFFFSVEKEREE